MRTHRLNSWPGALAATSVINGLGASAALRYMPYQDPACRVLMNDSTYDNAPKDFTSPNWFALDPALDTSTWFRNTQFPSAKIPTYSSSATVFGKVDGIAQGCALVVMFAYSQSEYGHVGSPDMADGNIVINADDKGCYPMFLPSGKDMALAACCNEGCAKYTAGNQALLDVSGATGTDPDASSAQIVPGTQGSVATSKIKKRSLSAKEEAEWEAVRQTQARKKKEKAQMRQRANAVTSLSERRLRRQRAAVPEAEAVSDNITPKPDAKVMAHDEFKRMFKRDDNNGCISKNVYGPWSEAAPQQAVASIQQCATTYCSFMISAGVSSGTSLTNLQQQETTTTTGGSITVSAGVNFFGAGVEVSREVSASISHTIGQATSTSITNTTTFTVTNNIGQAPGTRAFPTFTQTYVCYSADVKCPTDADYHSYNMCSPQVTADGGTVQGDYTVVYIK